VYSVVGLSFSRRAPSRGAPFVRPLTTMLIISSRCHAPIALYAPPSRSHLFHLFHLNASLRANFRSNVVQSPSLLSPLRRTARNGGSRRNVARQNFCAAIVEDSRTRRQRDIRTTGKQDIWGGDPVQGRGHGHEHVPREAYQV